VGAGQRGCAVCTHYHKAVKGTEPTDAVKEQWQCWRTVPYSSYS